MGNTVPYTPGEEGLQDQKIMEAIYQSAREGKPGKATGGREKGCVPGGTTKNERVGLFEWPGYGTYPGRLRPGESYVPGRTRT